MELTWVELAFLSSLLLIAAYYDFRFMIIPNWISIALIIGFVLYCVIVRPAADIIGWHVAGAFAVFLIGLIVFNMGLFGGGDVKLFAAIAFWLEPIDIIYVLTLVSFFGLGLALIRMAILVGKALWVKQTITYRQIASERIPYGIAIAFGTLTWLFRSDVMAFL